MVLHHLTERVPVVPEQKILSDAVVLILDLHGKVMLGAYVGEGRGGG